MSRKSLSYFSPSNLFLNLIFFSNLIQIFNYKFGLNPIIFSLIQIPLESSNHDQIVKQIFNSTHHTCILAIRHTRSGIKTSSNTSYWETKFPPPHISNKLIKQRNTRECGLTFTAFIHNFINQSTKFNQT